jgi:hypothetical protein
LQHALFHRSELGLPQGALGLRCAVLCLEALLCAPLPSLPAPARQVVEVVLVELAGGLVEHAPTTRVVLEQIAPRARLTVVHVEWGDK